MADAALFIGWGDVVHGRERQSLTVFGESIEFFTGLMQRGEIESFEPVALDPHGGDLQGFLLVRGDREKLNRMRYSEDFLRLIARASYIVENFGVVGADIGESVQRQYSSFQQITSDLT
jgi:hypothetical protein